MQHTPSPTKAAAHSSASRDDAAVLAKKGYRLKKTLGEGSYGKVKSAYSERLKRDVAVKIIDKKKLTQDNLERFLPREVEALKCLHHPSIIEVFDIFETSGGKVYIVMELGEKGDLLDYIQTTGAMEEDTACSKFQQLASAIKYCHDLDLAHRDLKCENILLDAGFNIKLSDFGYSKFLSRDANRRIILSKTFCGSSAYAAPEVLEGIPYDPRISDMWSLGVILYSMLFALMPFDDSNIKEMVRAQKRHKIHFSKSKHLTKESKNLIYRLLHPSVSHRLGIDEVLEHPWLQAPKSTIPSPLPEAEEGECSQSLAKRKPEHKQQAKPHSAEEGECSQSLGKRRPEHKQQAKPHSAEEEGQKELGPS
ncbi:testis-specific serine/threonine-protein kinase 2-like [Colius striatus]|uniref:testis-specific serine/threonine-protein kinase 2-like n=1 Tax=Colius striatus TaxID=57412 RepID=UPI002B1D1CE9|nr:testis-specific serine/threonine-protein kinase 2-like [Colius striatus]XP_061866130.1 testis-specific serine/threonine-protein kinase 2-like [Colius striatus]